MGHRGETVDEGVERERSSPETPFLFVALEGYRPHVRGARVALREARFVDVGRGDSRTWARDASGERLEIRIPSPAMSAVHARLRRDGATWIVEDVGSRNGTFLDGTRVSRATVPPGAVLELGRTFFFVGSHPSSDESDLDGESLDEAPRGLRTLLPSLAARHAALLRVAASLVPLLVLGASGTGKELIARAAHEESKRRGAFVAVNCGALPPNLVEASFFGHLRGAFSGAVRDEAGFVRAADGGTLFLDEIGDLPLSAQAALLRVLQEREVVPVGSTRAVPVDVRLVAATHRRLDELAARGLFREDLLARLRGYVFETMGLAERREDMGMLVADILAASERERRPETLSSGACRALLRYGWPYNVRELQQVLTTARVLMPGAVLEEEHLPMMLRQDPRPGKSGDGAPLRVPEVPAPDLAPADATLRAELVSALEHHRGNVAAVARSMGKATMQVHRWMKRFGLDPNRYRS